MNKLQQLIQQYCPNGVEWKTLGEIAENVSSGGTPSTGIEEYYGGNIPWLRTQEVGNGEIWNTGIKITELGLKNSSAKMIPVNCVIVAMYGATVGKVGINKIPLCTNQACANIQINEKIANYRYVYHFLLSQYEYIKSLGAGSQTNINLKIVKSLLIPIPCPDNPEKSLEIQQEIVRILDKFSTLTAELQAELQARKSQYEYYRNQLLTHPMEESDQPSLRSSRSATSIQKGDNPTQPLSTSNPHTGNSVLQPHNKVEWKTLGEVVLPTSNIRWKNTNKSYRYIDLTSVCRDNNTIIETIEINKENAPSRAQKLVLKNDVIFATTRPTQQRLCLIPEEYDGEVASSGYCVLRANIDLILPKWIYFWITSNKFKNYVEENQSGSAYPAISDAKVKEFKIPIPYPNDIKKSLEEQKRIITILDKFETLTTSITEGLPKEIELRQKQYEYYRDMLLTFPTDNIKA